jgi:hypothetical protein
LIHEGRAGVGPGLLEALRQIKAFVKAVGGTEQAEKVAAALDNLTLSPTELVRWLRVLREE